MVRLGGCASLLLLLLNDAALVGASAASRRKTSELNQQPPLHAGRGISSSSRSSSSSSSKEKSSVLPKAGSADSHCSDENSNTDIETIISAAPRGGGGGEKEILIPSPWAIGVGALLALNSGYLNGCCLSGLLLISKQKQAVAAVTGAYTLSALAFASGLSKSDAYNRISQPPFQSQLGMILSYLGGSCIAGFLNPRPVAFKLADSTGPTFLLGALLLYLSSRAATTVGTGGASAMTVFYLAAAANGLQNSVTSVHTANLIRSTHISGMTSDAGTYLGQLLRGNRQNAFRLCVNAVLALSFWTGSVVSYFAATQLFAGSGGSVGAHLLMVSASLYALIGVALLVVRLL